MKKVSLKSHHMVQASSNSTRQALGDQATAFIPYNKSWGVGTILGTVAARISPDQKCVLELSKIKSNVKESIVKCVGVENLEHSTAKYITFDVTYSEGYECYIIDNDSFQLYYGDINQFEPLQNITVFLEIKKFISPEGQPWVSESNYEEYAIGISANYECSDGTIVRNYQDFKVWEKELALRPNCPNYDVLPYQTSLEDIEHIVVSSDGTIWRDGTMVSEYLAWRRDPNHNYREGYYWGAYGVSNSFKEYAKLYNTTYFALKGLKRSEQHFDATYSFLFTSQEMADKYIDRLKSFQKRK